jgi:Domain of unknown function (DUF1707)
MNENIRISDADREHVAERLREHYAEGRLTADELDERLTAAFNAKTYGDLRGLMTDLPEPETVGPAGAAIPPADPWNAGPGGWQSPPPWYPGGRPIVAYRRGPRILPLVLIAFIAAIALPGAGFVAFAFLKLALLFFLVMCIAGIFAGARFRRRARRHWQQGPGASRQYYDWRR